MMGQPDRAPLLGAGTPSSDSQTEALKEVMLSMLPMLVFGYVTTVFSTVLPLWSVKWGDVGAVPGAIIESVNLVGGVGGLFVFGLEAERHDVAALVRVACGLCVVR